MDAEQELEWNAAQSIVISEDLVAAAKRQLQFLAAVDKNRWLYEGQTLQWAIYRYNACWLPLLAKYSESRVTKGPLVVPLDCQWIWHCHRLNPVRYKSDCEELYGRVLDNCNVVSSIQGISRSETEEIWNKLYPDESFDFDFSRALSSEFSEAVYGTQSFSKYNFTLAVERQSPFFYQVSRPHVNKDIFLESAFERYKGFLHIIRRNRQKSIRRFCVPTYDIDLIWHTHQLHPASYCKDLIELIGNILNHDDTDQDRGKGQKLDTGFSETTLQWEETFGSRYWRAGAMYRGAAPSPVTTTPCVPEAMTNKPDLSSIDTLERLIDIPKIKYIEVLLQFVEIKNLPDSHKGKVEITFSKSEPDGIFDVKRNLTIQSETGQKRVAIFQCQPTGFLFFELLSQLNSKPLGSCFISMEEFFRPVTKLSVEKWFDLVPNSDVIITSEPISLRVAASCTLPIPAPHEIQMLRSSNLLRSFCSFPVCGKMRSGKSWTPIIDTAGEEILNLQMRNVKTTKGVDNKLLTKEIYGVTKSGQTRVLGQLLGQQWSLMDSLWSLTLPNINDKKNNILLTGPRMVKLYSGRKLDFEPKHHDKQTKEHNFMTAVEFSVEYPYGKSIALFDFKSGLVTLQEGWFTLPGIISAFIVSKQRI